MFMTTVQREKASIQVNDRKNERMRKNEVTKFLNQALDSRDVMKGGPIEYTHTRPTKKKEDWRFESGQA